MKDEVMRRERKKAKKRRKHPWNRLKGKGGRNLVRNLVMSKSSVRKSGGGVLAWRRQQEKKGPSEA